MLGLSPLLCRRHSRLPAAGWGSRTQREAKATPGALMMKSPRLRGREAGRSLRCECRCLALCVNGAAVSPVPSALPAGHCVVFLRLAGRWLMGGMGVSLEYLRSTMQGAAGRSMLALNKRWTGGSNLPPLTWADKVKADSAKTMRSFPQPTSKNVFY